MLVLKVNLKILFLIGLGQWTQAAFLRYYTGSIEDYIEVELQKPLPLLQFVDYSKPTLFFAFGFNAGPDTGVVMSITNAFIEKNDTNYILVNWKFEAYNDRFDPEIAHAVTATPNSIIIGKELGITLLQLSCSLDMATVHLAGHSLGAHLVGYAATFARERGITIGRITGLDPSSFKYEGYVYSRGLDSHSAAFVAIWHTNPGDFGTTQALGDVDIWFNCDDAVQPGCPNDGPLYKYSDHRATCSHRSAAVYFAEAVSSPESFVAVRAPDCMTWEMNDTFPTCDANNILYINENINTDARGFYYLSTNSHQPYGRGKDGIRPN